MRTRYISAFIAKYATCQIPYPTLCPTLHEHVMRFQQHKYDYCLQRKNQKLALGRFVDLDFQDLSVAVQYVLWKQWKVENV